MNSDLLPKRLCVLGSILLTIIGIFHASGISYVNSLVQNSDVTNLVKSIFPILFILPTIQLFGFAIFGLIASYMGQHANKVLIPLSILILIDAMLAFYLNAIIPGLILALPSAIFFFVALRKTAKEAI